MSTEVVQAEFREIVPAEQKTLLPAPLPTGTSVIDDFFRAVPIPSDWTRTKVIDGQDVEVPYFLNRAALGKKTPKTRIKIHYQGFPYVDVNYVRQRLDEAADNGRWGYYRTLEELGDPYTKLAGQDKKPKQYRDARVIIVLLVPGCLPQFGEGSAPLAVDDVSDPRHALSAAYNSAESSALKNAAKKLGIATDVSEDPEATKYLQGQQVTCKTFFDMAVGKGNKTKAIAAVKTLAPGAIQAEELIQDRLDEDVVDQILDELMKLAA